MMAARMFLLNEVLSLNAQESGGEITPDNIAGFLNEVLSLNAQESAVNVVGACLIRSSSMKS